MPSREEDDNSASVTSKMKITVTVKNQTGGKVFVILERSTRVKKLLQRYCERESLDVNSVALVFHGCFLRWEQTPIELGMVDGDKIYALHANSVRSNMQKDSYAQKSTHEILNKMMVAEKKVAEDRHLIEQMQKEILFLSREQSRLAKDLVDVKKELVKNSKEDAQVRNEVKDTKKRVSEAESLSHNELKRTRPNEPTVIKHYQVERLSTVDDEDNISADSSHITIKVVTNYEMGKTFFVRIRRSTKMRVLMEAFYKWERKDYGSVCFVVFGRHIRQDQTSNELQMDDGDEIDVFKY